ncbi:site-specific integrase [Micromonospora sp. CPCC 206061]|uniref:site-specific integrase n=1 Tax=Micromonospora sp. CPCC 206061 TaxID=3122410 RepID=UPI002FF20A86
MATVLWVQGEGPLAPFVAGYRRCLEQLGYSSRSVRERIEVVGRLSRWLVLEGLSVAELTPERVEQFLEVWRAAGQQRVPTMRTLVPLFDHLREQRVLAPAPALPVTALAQLLGLYSRYLVQDRGLAPLTVLRYLRMAKRFLVRRASQPGGGETGAEGLDGAEINGYLLECCSRLVVESAKREAADLRSLLKFLYLQGLTATDLGSAMPPVAGWRDTRLPATMTAAQVTALLEGCDRSRPAGLRDLAVLSLLARLGLRSGEVAALQLGDIDWRAGEILVRGKARRDERLPLTVEAGEAIAAYLRHGRPASRCPKVFLTCYAPFRGIHPRSITRVVYRACRRAGLEPVGGHRLRHALATQMLRQGGDLVEISQVLRHRDLATTSVYAKLDRTALRTVARPWPGTER